MLLVRKIELLARSAVMQTQMNNTDLLTMMLLMILLILAINLWPWIGYVLLLGLMCASTFIGCGMLAVTVHELTR